ncbi:Protein CBG09062 [Caenorhabditis briggsae]|uniref:Uncharacterized protein n=2 Tax=Caenorhabditis briggsae TaxID=6238 RepID=A0AAE9EJJ7_CAEBR|nr:Protein CBG09062 [Caenorhabditis briggsae]ULT99502.1 hypothetical protein L3Y34_000665 [Caenorhabditis briggsae]UMM22178.1 hypothetical protein L5515_003524 [Caenorhabditis briggsae]CAP28724.1 Protein CBG09062 [Caenorhabditis briggsae]
MNLIHANNRWEQLRAVEADLLSPPPADPFQCYPEGWSRAADLKENEWERILLREKSVSPAPRAHSPGSFRRAIRRMGQARQNRPDPVQLPERRARQPVNRQEAPAPVENAPELRRRAISPTQLPGVRAIPKDYNRFFRGLLTPGEYFAKSQTRYLGPFEAMPTVETLPSDDEYVILQRMGRLPDSGKSIFRQVGSLSTRITN